MHSLMRRRVDDTGACATADGMIQASLDGRPLDMAALRTVEGSIMDMAGRADDARAAYEEALSWCRSVGGAQASVCAGHALARLGRPDEAEAAFQEALREDPDNAVAYLELGHPVDVVLGR